MSTRTVYSPQIPYMLIGERRNCGMSFDNELPAGELLDSALTVAPSTGGPVVEGSAIIPAPDPILINGEWVYPGRGIVFILNSSGTAPGNYDIIATCNTDASNIQTITVIGKIDIIDPNA